MAQPPLPVSFILGAEESTQVITRVVTQLTENGLLSETVAYRVACEQALNGDPWVLAARDQVWELQDDEAPLPSQRVAVVDRLPDRDEPKAILRPLDGPLADRLVLCPLTVLTSYRLVSWHPPGAQPIR